MKRVTKSTQAILAVALIGAGGVAALTGPALGQEAMVSVPATDLIVARRAGMDLQGGNLDAIKAAVGSKAEVKPLQNSAKALAAWGHAIPGLFVPGTGQGDNTKALPAVFSDQAGFAKAAGALSDAAMKLAAAAGADDKTAFAAAFQQVGEACGACHRNYRAK